MQNSLGPMDLDPPRYTPTEGFGVHLADGARLPWQECDDPRGEYQVRGLTEVLKSQPEKPPLGTFSKAQPFFISLFSLPVCVCIHTCANILSPLKAGKWDSWFSVNSPAFHTV